MALAICEKQEIVLSIEIEACLRGSPYTFIVV